MGANAVLAMPFAAGLLLLVARYLAEPASRWRCWSSRTGCAFWNVGLSLAYVLSFALRGVIGGFMLLAVLSAHDGGARLYSDGAALMLLAGAIGACWAPLWRAFEGRQAEKRGGDLWRRSYVHQRRQQRRDLLIVAGWCAWPIGGALAGYLFVLGLDAIGLRGEVDHPFTGAVIGAVLGIAMRRREWVR